MIKEAGAGLINSLKGLADYGLVVWQEAWAKDKAEPHSLHDPSLGTGFRYCPFCELYGPDLEEHIVKEHRDKTWVN